MPFRDVIGHRRIVALLARSVARDSLPPSLIFAGPAGVGKRLTATAVAQALNCLNTWDGLKTVPYRDGARDGDQGTIGRGQLATVATVGNALQGVPLDLQSIQ